MIMVTKNIQRQLKDMGFRDASIPLMLIGLCDFSYDSNKFEVIGEKIEYEKDNYND